MQYMTIRDAIGSALVDLGKKDERVVVINADLSSTCRTRQFCETFPNRSFNVGIAEQNMVSFAAGLAHEGFIPYVCTMAPFLSMRACEQIRTDVAYSNLPVKFIAIYAGVSGGISGATHWGMEDVAIMSAIPNIRVWEPADDFSACEMLINSCVYNGPVYIRCSILPCNHVYGSNIGFNLTAGATVLRPGDDGAYICSGVTVQFALEASEEIHKQCGKSCAVIDMYSIKPIAVDAILFAASKKRIVVAEDHNIYGGLGSMVSMVIAEKNLNVKLKICGIPDVFAPMSHAEFLYHKFGYDSDGLKQAMYDLL